MNFKPSFNHILVDPMEEETVTQHGLYLPNNVASEIHKGKVTAIGQGHILFDGTLKDCIHKVGDIILYSNFYIKKLKIKDHTYHIIKDNDPFGVLKEEE